jgi:hypothetical protein
MHLRLFSWAPECSRAQARQGHRVSVAVWLQGCTTSPHRSVGSGLQEEDTQP